VGIYMAHMQMLIHRSWLTRRECFRVGLWSASRKCSLLARRNKSGESPGISVVDPLVFGLCWMVGGIGFNSSGHIPMTVMNIANTDGQIPKQTLS